MNYLNELKNLKEKIIKNSPSYVDHSSKKTLTSKLLNVRTKIGITKLFYPGSHIEGEVKIWDRRFKNHPFKFIRIFGSRGELFYIGLAFFIFKKYSSINVERERIVELLNDRNVFMKIDGIDEKYLKYNK